MNGNENLNGMSNSQNNNEDIYASYNNNNNNGVNLNTNMNNNTPLPQGENSVFVKNIKKKSNLLLYGFYAFVLLVGAVVFFVFRSDRYEFYVVKNEVSISRGSSYQVELTPKNAQYFDYLNYKYEIANKDIATVDEFGTVTAVGVGETTLKISLSPGFVSKTMRIVSQGTDIQTIGLYVYKDKEIKKESSISVSIGESVTLKAIGNDDDNLAMNVNYTSSNPDVAVVDLFGNVTAKASGVAIISGTRDGITGEITVNVVEDEQPVDNPTNSGTGTEPSQPGTGTQPSNPNQGGSSNSSTNVKVVKVDLGTDQATKIVGESLSLKTKLTPSSAKAKSVKWSSSNPSVATVSKSGVVKALKKGTAVITVNVDGIEASCTVIVKEKATTPKEPEPQAPAGTQVKANEVTINKTSLVVEKGKTNTFVIKVSGAGGVVTVSSSDPKVATVSVSNSECNGLSCFFDASLGSDSSITFTVTGVSKGQAYINVALEDLVSYTDDKNISGSGKVGILVK